MHMNQHNLKENLQNLHDPDFDESEQEDASPPASHTQVGSRVERSTSTATIFSLDEILNHIPPRIAFVFGLMLSFMIIATVGFLWALPLIWKQIIS
ncbi:MAG: hypothetical protein A3B74_04605 [Candidatus Kerfeldbacteria bacterium RIFCSPHIGHO2_02_FULL_42_14]|uniref:Uncharacterized protein n=1 Tax=Candidatus Kerfeldbacteria bacterium RIFCSPHIGHO2_02_FULL_42_14 TaxID=1798540 RepID=A0A1G2ARH8_9BACT|nr:MAG: hypothetical protein A3B74_04605 [Candidatus Kerfeldbacteria bacterium RIFCSPHIGHO2_02_FULL_42_14]OGY81007.1 MAG: hypothetical protein A3E60_03325 [Candidatus Kerfeldbacteria bacterium RIFCSPHIGHO2_12_FULL_42_13]OGY84959.1 MAG: hypothetical protein A3I91_00550 [Candidatus Kerfeldbacteria bacterium RIFCSPLOWO2_02_FULL_42_19]OGY86126.1 MAG: hypothetical protein A3G01_02080 [Candidatus Kerfeldbacteria bacterium RIFCSPLOWO2_12_FULL_43_9]